jgi:hypothetical protein
MLQNVTVLMDIMKMQKKTVNLVDGNVSLVLVLLITVLTVKKTELMLKFLTVHVHLTKDFMKLINNHIAHHVIQLVLLVPFTSLVKLAHKTLTEPFHQIVNVKMDISKEVSYVLNVNIHVLLVSMMLETVSLVPVTEYNLNSAVSVKTVSSI